jgi:hypothetical protein
MSETTTIQITKQIRDELRKIGTMGDDYNKVINDLIVEHNWKKCIDLIIKTVYLISGHLHCLE